MARTRARPSHWHWNEGGSAFSAEEALGGGASNVVQEKIFEHSYRNQGEGKGKGRNWLAVKKGLRLTGRNIAKSRFEKK